MNIFNIPSYSHFLKSLYGFIIEKSQNEIDVSNFTVLLPSRRSCNELKRIFLEQSKNEAIILPNIRAIGDIDYDDLILKIPNKDDLNNYIDFTANTSRIKYKILLIKELLSWSKTSNKSIFKNITMEQITNLALELEKFLNEVIKNNLSLDDLSKIVDDEYSEHWQEILNFLQTFGKRWNLFIKNNNIVSMIDFRTKILSFNAEYFKNNKPTNPILIAGVSGNIISTCNLIKSLTQYDNCYFIFKGLDKNLTDDEWGKINIFHPQYSFKHLLENYICIKRDEIIDLDYKNDIVNEKLEKIISYSMLPYCETYKWQENININDVDLENISKVECTDIFQELDIISFITKYNYSNSNKTIAIITNNEIFANQLEIKLNNFNIKVNNVFGNKISRTDYVKFLFLILDVLKTNYEPIALLSLLKHKFTLIGLEKSKLNQLILILEDNILRGSGNIRYKKIKEKIKHTKNQELINFFDNFSNIIGELKCENSDFQTILQKHIDIAKKLASNDNINADDIFWNNNTLNGSELLVFFNELLEESKNYGNIHSCEEYSYLLDYLIAENSYAEKYSIHPMVNIISTQEAKLINYDLVIISNLNDGEFPNHITTDPWMSKSMRKKFNLPAKEEMIGNYAYDFTQLLCNNKVILTRSLKNNGTPTTKSKYLMRFETFLLCQNKKIQENDIWKEIYKKYNEVKDFSTISRPKPTPPLEKRPKKLYATQIEKLMNNPYDIYAKSILKLRKKDSFYDDKIFSFFGQATHKALELYTKYYEKNKDGDLYEKLIKYGKESFDEYFNDEITKELFFIRFINIARWFVEEDKKIREAGYNIYAENEKEIYIQDLDFTLSAIVDRIEEKQNTNIINIADYKTGTQPSNTDVLSGKKPQLVIEAIIMENQDKNVDKLAFWSVKGKNDDKISEIKTDNLQDLIYKGKNGIYKLIKYFKIYENSYIATAFDLNDNNHYSSDYKHLSRVEEWGYL